MAAIERQFKPLKNDTFIKACFGEKVDRIPIFLHRQAGRYLPEYRELKGDKDFFTMCRDPEIACEITLQPTRRFDLDAAIIFSDILTIPQAMGIEVQMIPKTGPYFPKTLLPEDVKTLNFNAPLSSELKYVYDAVSLTREKLEGKMPLIGFAGGPWTLMCYMIEGKSDKTKTLAKPKSWLKHHPAESEALLKGLSKLIVEHLLLQAEHGAQVVEVFDTLAGLLPEPDFRRFVLPRLRDIAAAFKAGANGNTDGAEHKMENGAAKKNIRKVPLILFAKGANHSLRQLAETGADVLAVDSGVQPAQARRLAGEGVALMGNLQPEALYESEPEIRRRALAMAREFGPRGYAANLGHGMRPDMRPEAVAAFVEAVHSVKVD